MQALNRHTNPVVNAASRVETDYVVPTDWAAERSFHAFVEQSSQHLLTYLRPVVRDSVGIDAEDALQEALIRLAREWDELPADPAARKNYIYRALRCSAVDAMRKWSGRGSSRGRVRSADLELAETAWDVDAAGTRDGELASIGRAICRQAARHDEAEQALVRSVLVAALAALKPVEAQVIFGLAGNASREELAEELGIDTNRVRNVAQEARDVLRPLIVHANGAQPSPAERDRLFRYLDGELRGRERRLVRRHVSHCTTCRSIAALEQRVAEAGARLVLPLPALAIAAQGAVAIAGSASAAAGAAGVGGAGTLGLTGAFAGMGTQLAAGVATVVVLGAGGAAVFTDRPEKTPHRAHARDRATPTRAAPTRAPVATASVATPTTTHALRVRPSAPRQPVKEPEPEAKSVPATPTQTSARRDSPEATRPATEPPPDQPRRAAATEPDGGGEFVIGGGG